jgi:monofunctional biosynthetic peptidoglycan transglycosylase
MAARKRSRYRLRRAIRVAALGGLLLAAAYLAWQLATWPDVGALRRRPPQTTAFIEAWKRARRAQGSSARPQWRVVPYGRISRHLKQAVLVGEDGAFFDHQGFDLHELRLAVREAVEEGGPPRGASTLTQQLAKNLWLSPSRDPVRKLKEAILTRQLERTLGKRRILELYLNVVEFGPGVFGAEAAARRFYGKGADALTPHEAAELAAGLPRSTWHPGVRSRAYHRHVARIEARMARARHLLARI